MARRKEPAEGPEALRQAPRGAVSHRERPEESEVRCRAGAGPRRAEPVPRDAAAARRVVQAVAAEHRARPLALPVRVVAVPARREPPSVLRVHAAEERAALWALRAEPRVERPEAARAVRRAAVAERDVPVAVRPWAAQAGVPSAGPAAEHAVAAAVAQPSEVRAARPSAAPSALPSDQVRPARRRWCSRRSASPFRRKPEAATATASRSRWWQEGAV